VRRPRPRPAPPPLPRPGDTPPGISETELALDEIALILEGQSAGETKSGRPSGRCFSIASAPTIGIVQMVSVAKIRLRGFQATPSVNLALTKNGMGVGSGGLLADQAGNILNAPLDIAGGQIIFCGATSSTALFQPLNIIVETTERVFIIKNQNAQVQVNVYYDIVD